MTHNDGLGEGHIITLERKVERIQDILRLVLEADDVTYASSCGLRTVIPPYEILPDEFLEYAENAIAVGKKEGIVNAVSNLKRALDCEIDIFFENINLKKFIKKNNLRFEQKTQFLAEIGLFQNRSVNKLNKFRNSLEHEYKVPELSDLDAYYELIWSVIRIVNLQLALMHAHNEVEMTVHKEGRELLLALEYDRDCCAVRFQLVDCGCLNGRKIEDVSITMNDAADVAAFTMAFNFYLLSINYIDYGNQALYQKRLKSLSEKISIN